MYVSGFTLILFEAFFFVGNLKITNSVFFLAIVLFRFSTSSWVVCILVSLIACVFLEICPFHLIYLICWPKVVCNIYIYVKYIYIKNFFFNFCKVGSDVSSFISDFSNLSLFFSWWVLLRFVNFIGLFKESTFGFIDFSLLFFILSFTYFCSNLYYFLPSDLDLFCSSFSSFLRWEVVSLIWTLFPLLMKL